MLRTLFGKLLVALLGFGAMMIAVFAVIVQSSHQNYHLELDQRAAAALAGRIVAQGIDVDGEDSAGGLDIELARTAALSTGVDLYVLDERGEVLASSIPPASLKRDRVDMTPLRRYLEDAAAAPILGADPSDDSRSDVFSIASIPSGTHEGKYLYALLHRREHQDGAGLIKAEYLLGDGLWLVAAGTLLALVSSFAISRALTRRLRRLTADIEKFRQSGFTVLPDEGPDPQDRPKDEVGRLDGAFSEMAKLIVRQMRDLNRTDAMRRELLASVSHELRAPLTSMQRRLEKLTRKEASLTADDRQEHLEIATRQTSRMSKLVGKLLDLARLDAHQMPFDRQSFVLPDLVHEVLQKVSLAATDARVSLHADIPEHLPLAFADIGLVERVLDHLVENALRHTAGGGAICIRLARTPQGIAVEVADTGAGIEPRHLARLFDRFVPVRDSRPGTPDGEGRGLVIVKSILELHGSEIGVESAVGVGTTFRFEIAARSAALPARASADMELAGPVRLRSGTS